MVIKQNENKILAIAPATKRFGAAILKDWELIYFAVKPLRPPRINESIKTEVSNSIEHLIKEFTPKVIVIKSPGKQQLKSIQFKLIAESIERRAEFNQVPVIRIKFETVKKFLCRNQKPIKANTFKSLADVYPELRQFFGNSNKSRREYYDSLLIAAALGYYYQTGLVEAESQNSNPIIS